MEKTRLSILRRMFKVSTIVLCFVFLLIYTAAVIYAGQVIVSRAERQQNALLNSVTSYLSATQSNFESSIDMVYGDLFTLNDICNYMNLEETEYKQKRFDSITNQSSSNYRGKEQFISQNFANNSQLVYIVFYGFEGERIAVYDRDAASSGNPKLYKAKRKENNFYKEYEQLAEKVGEYIHLQGKPYGSYSRLLNNMLVKNSTKTGVMFVYDLQEFIADGLINEKGLIHTAAVKQSDTCKLFEYNRNTGKVDFLNLTDREYKSRYANGENRKTNLVRGGTYVTVSTSDRDIALWIVKDALIMLGAGFLVLISAAETLKYFMSKNQRRMDRLLEGINCVKQGDLTVRIDCDSQKDDIGLISEQFNQMCEQLQAYIKRTYEAQLRSKNAQLLALENQINPHFLYNTLEIIRMKALTNNDTVVQKMIYNLASMYRNLAKDDTFITIESEIEYSRNFIELFRMAYENTEIDYCIDAEPQLMDCLTIKFLLEPLIENFFIHGVNHAAEENTLLILVAEDENQKDEVLIRVESLGMPVSREKVDDINKILHQEEDFQSRKYIGIRNVNQRIKNVYGDQYGLTLERNEEDMMVSLVRIPKRGGV
ncbi:sensor histidine kinase [Caproiciproducens galactitolivorans]|uniref:Histidine kinase n=1 Tax=Caproiciproducens galactitolivorans TaxID=642589 RepID=A0ABT4BSD1_9FIRM|nr:histidine kinase [Caproiciproducens galactitolivorans]MCY1713787.1 histidine kinase [Caproiciproducens galactitolivorans]